jgi:rare lipoprotein A
MVEEEKQMIFLTSFSRSTWKKQIIMFSAMRRKNKGYVSKGILMLLILLHTSGCTVQISMGGRSARESGKYVEKGLASWYGSNYYGKRTASGEIYTGRELTAAHRNLPFGTKVRVRRLDTGRSVVVRINDRGPFKKGRIIDLSERAAKEIGLKREGVTKVEIRVVEW